MASTACWHPRLGPVQREAAAGPGSEVPLVMPTGLRAHSSGFLACLPPGCGARICSQALLGLPSPAWPAKPCLACCHNCHSQLRLASARLAAGQRVQRSSSECSAPPALLGLPGRTPPSFPARKAQRLPAHLQLLHSQSQPPLQRTRTPPSGSPPGSTTARAESSRGHLEVPRALGAAAWRKGGVGGASSRLPCSDPIRLCRRAGWRRVGCQRTCIAPSHQPRLNRPHWAAPHRRVGRHRQREMIAAKFQPKR